MVSSYSPRVIRETATAVASCGDIVVRCNDNTIKSIAEKRGGKEEKMKGIVECLEKAIVVARVIEAVRSMLRVRVGTLSHPTLGHVFASMGAEQRC